MSMFEVRRAEGLEAYRQQICGLVRSRKEHSEHQFSTVRRRFPALYELYRGIYRGRVAPHKNQLHVPLIFSTIQSDVARKTQTSFGNWPIVGFVGQSPEDAMIARKREALVNVQLKDCGSFQKAYDFFLTADLYGTAVVQYGWRHDEEDTMLSRAEVLPVTGEIIQVLDKRSIIRFDGPDWKVLDPLDCFPQPGFKDIEQMDWFIVREFMDFDEIRRLSTPDSNGRSTFNAAEVRRMESEGGSFTQVGEDFKNYRAGARNQMEEDARQKEQYGRPVELLTMWGKIPSELTTDGITNRKIVIGNGGFRLVDKPNPFWNGKKPLRKYSPMPDPHYFWAAGKAEIAEKLQVTANRFTNQQLDALDLFIDPVFLINSDAGVNIENFFIRPGKGIEVSGVPTEMIQALVPNLSGVQLGGQMTEVLWKWMQQGMGIIEDTVMGGAGQRQTAREFLGRSEAVATRLLLESRLFEEGFLEPLADDFVDLNRQFLPLPREVFILGKSAEVDPVTGLPIPQSTRQTIDGWDMVPNYEARAVGATTRMNRGNRQQALTFLLQAASQNPIAASAINWLAFFRDVFRAFEMDNVDELIARPDEREKMLIAAGLSGQSRDVPGTPNQASPGGIPNMVGQGVM